MLSKSLDTTQTPANSPKTDPATPTAGHAAGNAATPRPSHWSKALGSLHKGKHTIPIPLLACIFPVINRLGARKFHERSPAIKAPETIFAHTAPGATTPRSARRAARRHSLEP